VPFLVKNLWFSDVVLEVGLLSLNYCPGYERARLSEAILIQLYRTLKIRQSFGLWVRWMSNWDSILCSSRDRRLVLLSNRTSIQSLDETMTLVQVRVLGFVVTGSTGSTGRALCLAGGRCAYWEGVVHTGGHWRNCGYLTGMCEKWEAAAMGGYPTKRARSSHALTIIDWRLI
jgi:hypothetical protein